LLCIYAKPRNALHSPKTDRSDRAVSKSKKIKL
jgi:hypothetical protein